MIYELHWTATFYSILFDLFSPLLDAGPCFKIFIIKSFLLDLFQTDTYYQVLIAAFVTVKVFYNVMLLFCPPPPLCACSENLFIYTCVFV